MNSASPELSTSPPFASPESVTDVLSGGGEMGGRIRDLRWDETPLGPLASWPRSLLTAVATCLSSRFPIMVLWGPQLVMLYNDAYRTLLGSKHPASLGQPAAVCWPEIWPEVGPRLHHVLATGEASWLENQQLLLERHGFREECYFTHSDAPIRDESGTVVGILTAVAETTSQVLDARRLTTLQRLTARVASARGVQEAGRRALDAITLNVADLPFVQLYLYDPQSGTAQRVPGAVTDVLSVPASAPVWPFAEVLAHGRAQIVQNLDAQKLDLPSWEGTPACSSALVLPVLGADAAVPLGMLVVGLSRRLSLDSRYRGFLELLASGIATALGNARADGMLADARRAVRSREEVLAIVSHDLRTPLTSIATAVELQLRSLGDDERDTRLRRQNELIRRSVQRLDRLIEDLLDLGSIDTGTLSVELSSFPVESLFEDLHESFDSVAARKDVTLTLCSEPELEHVTADRGRLLQVLSNLLTNALKFTPGGGSVELFARRVSDGVSLSIRDTGVGIPAEALPHVFERYWHAAPANRDSHGLGLAIARGIVELLGGTLSVESQLGVGSVFSVLLPESATSNTSSAAATGTRLRVLPGALSCLAPDNGNVLSHPPHDFLAGGGEMGKLIRALDWDTTPLGPPVHWPQSLRSIVSLCLASNIPLSLVWGAHHTQLYNDAYAPLCGGHHREALGQDFARSSAWPVLHDAFERALLGEPQHVENVQRFVARGGLLEETFFTFSFSPIRDESGAIAGLLHPVTETTSQVLSQRRTRLLRELLARTAGADSTEDALSLAMQVLESSELDLPFVLLYTLDETTRGAQLTRALGLRPGGASTREHVELTGESFWPLARVLESREALQVNGLAGRLDVPVCGPYSELPDSALVLPLSPTGPPTHILIVGLSARLVVDEAYRGFCELLASTISTALGRAREATSNARSSTELRGAHARDQFLTLASHELRTPVTALALQLELLSRPRTCALSAEQLQDKLVKMQRPMKRLSQLVLELAEVAEVLTQRPLPARQPLELRRLAESVLGERREAARRLVCALSLHSADSVRGHADPEQFCQVLAKLVDNALKFGAGKPVEVALESDDVGCTLSVRDHGVGIALADRARIFQRFERAVDTYSHGGFGLGLWLVAQIVEAHEGDIEVSDTPGGGATFTVRLPHAQA